MATLIPPTQGTGYFPSAGAAPAFTACDPTNGNYFNPSGYDLLIVKGVGTFTIQGEADIEGRSTDDAIITVAAGERYMKLFDSTVGYIGAQGIQITGSAATVLFAVVRL
jgi:hypothetical protein